MSYLETHTQPCSCPFCSAEKSITSVDYPIIMGQRITREEIIEGLRGMYDAMVKYEKIADPALVRFPDAETILDYIEQSGLPPKIKSDDD